MVLALMNQFDPRILDAINEYVYTRPVIDWKRVWGFTFIYKTRHFVTNGYPRGGYVYFHRQRNASWYIWYMEYSDNEPQYTCLTLNVMSCTWEEDGRSEYMAILPDDFHDHE